MTNCSWDVVWEKNIYEFFNVIAFCRDYNEKRNEMIEKWKRTH